MSKWLIAALFALLALSVNAQPTGTNAPVGSINPGTQIIGGSTGDCVTKGSTNLVVMAACGGSATSVSVGSTTITGGTTGRLLYDNAGALGETTTTWSAGNVKLGGADAASPTAQTVSMQSVVAGTSNTAGVSMTIAGSQGTGTGAGGSLLFQTAAAGTTGTSQNALATVLTVNSALQTVASSSTSAALPALAFAGDTASGIYQRTANTLGFSVNATQRWEMLSTVTRTRNDMAIGWTSGAASAGADTGLSRTTAGVVAFGTGAQGSVAGTFNAATGILNTLASDATHTDATVCTDTTTGQLYKGSGTLGICLGTSSARFKERIVDLHVGLKQVEALRPVSYFYIPGQGDNGARVQYGLIAEDVVKVVPELVGLDSAQRANSVDLVGLVPVLVNAIRELKAEVDELKGRSANAGR